MNNIAVIGAGFSGLSAACTLAARNQTVTIFEKNSTVGGRARVLDVGGFRFDMGPSWYWMPDIFERFFESVGERLSDYYSLIRLDPAFKLIFPGGDSWDVPGHFEPLVDLFETTERGSGKRLRQFMKEASIKYELGVKSLAFKPGRSLLEYLNWRLLSNLHHLNLFTRFDRYIGSFFRDRRLQQLMEFPVLFLGTQPRSTPALYSFMNYGGFVGGTWYPVGGMGSVVDALARLANSLGVKVELDAAVESITVESGRVSGIIVGGRNIACDGVIASADYQHVDQRLLPPICRQYTTHYWDSKTLTPSALIFYLGVSRRLPRLLHHNLFFDGNFAEHVSALYQHPRWPMDPLFYLCCPSQTDPTVSPTGHENLFILVPISADLEDSEEARDLIFRQVLTRLEHYTETAIVPHLVVNQAYCLRDFTSDYNAFKGNAYGLANTLRQTAIGKPRASSSKVKRLVYAGQLTVPGPGVPPSLISGQIAAKLMLEQFAVNS